MQANRMKIPSGNEQHSIVQPLGLEQNMYRQLHRLEIGIRIIYFNRNYAFCRQYHLNSSLRRQWQSAYRDGKYPLFEFIHLIHLH